MKGWEDILSMIKCFTQLKQILQLFHKYMELLSNDNDNDIYVLGNI